MEDELLNKGQLLKQVLHMDTLTADKYILYRKGFPYIQVGSQRRYLKSAVIEWLKDNLQETK